MPYIPNLKEIYERISNEFILEINNEATRTGIRNRFQEELSDEFVVVCSLENNPPRAMDLGCVVVDIYDKHNQKVTRMVFGEEKSVREYLSV